MADLIRTIKAETALTDQRRRNVASSIRRLCAALSVAPEQAPAAFWFLRERLERFHPAQAGITSHRWETIRSDVGFALKRIGLAPDQPKPDTPLSADWSELEGRSKPLRQRRWSLSRLIRYCDGQGIGPAAVNDAVISAFGEYLRTQTLKAKPEHLIRDASQLWNRLADLAPELGVQQLTIVNNRKTYSPDWEALPSSLRQEIETWLGSLSEEADLLSENGPTHPLRPASIKSYRYALLQAIAGLIHSGRPLESITSLAKLVEPKAAEAALEFHRTRMGKKQSQMLGQIAHVLVLVAQHVVGGDDPTVAKLKRMRARVGVSRAGLKPRPREALRQFVERENIEKLLILPQRLHRRLLGKKVLTVADARLMQVAVALELLLMRPIRRANLVGLRLGQHVLSVGKRTVIVLDEDEVKNRVAHDYPIPPESVRLLDFYVTRLLPLLGPNPERFLFPGEIAGRPKSAEQLGRQFRKTILAETGLDIHPHLMRHFAATLYLTENPGGMEVARRVLGHRSADTTSRSYAGVHDQVAVRRYDELVLGIRGAILKEIGHG
jgi:integrase